MTIDYAISKIIFKSVFTLGISGDLFIVGIILGLGFFTILTIPFGKDRPVQFTNFPSGLTQKKYHN